MYEKEQRYLDRVINRYFKTKKEAEAENKFDDGIEVSELDQQARNEDRERKDAIRALYYRNDDAAKFLASNGLMLAGGTINSIFTKREINDLDFYLKDITKLDDVVQGLEKEFGYKKVFTSDNAYTFRKKFRGKDLEVQIITRFFGEPDFILNTFDFTIVQGLYDFQSNEFILSERFIVDCAKRELVFTNTSQYPICALYRTKKYIKRGYHITGANMVALALAIHALKIKTYADLKDQLNGIDTSMLDEITKDFDDSKSFEVNEFVREWLDLAMNFDSAE
jgi:hypothetical protein